MAEDRVKIQILDFQYSFGYNCRRLHNLCVCDENIVAWTSGSIVTFFDVSKKERFFHKSETGGNIGHITKNSSNIVAIGYGKSYEFSPLIEIYEWPSMNSLKILKGGTENSYTQLNFSHDGKLLASLGDSPDYYLTIWDWENALIILEMPAYTSSVYNSRFSPYFPNQLLTCGSDHIKFWKMALTSTGLKLKGTLGRFGNTDICDIFSILALPDEKVLSGCTWGNILVWEENSIKFEILRKGRTPCHSADIMQILYSAETNEITTISADGHICTWYWNIKDLLDINENDPIEEMNPVSEIILPKARLFSIKYRRNNEWFAQDATGAVWEINLEFDSESVGAKELQPNEGKKIVVSHGAAVVGIAPLNIAPFLISLGSDGSLFIHKIPNGPVLAVKKYKHNATCMVYMPNKIDSYERTLVIGFDNGTINLVLIDIIKIMKNESHTDYDDNFILIQLLKPHKKRITTINVNDKSFCLLTASEDSTIFLYKITNRSHVLHLLPLYYIETPNIIYSIVWKHSDANVILLSGTNCLILEGKLPNTDKIPNLDKLITFEKTFLTMAVTELKNYDLTESADTKKSSRKSISKIIDSLELVELNESTRTILWAKYDPNHHEHVWVAQEFCNCIFRITPGKNGINKYVYLNGNFDDNITSHLYIEHTEYFITGQSNGEIAIFKMPSKIDDNSQMLYNQLLQKLKKNPKKKKKLDPVTIIVPKLLLKPLEKLIMHDTQSGKVVQMVLDVHKRVFYTSGEDGNIFSYSFNLSTKKTPDMELKFDMDNFPEVPKGTVSQDDPGLLSHEDYIQNKERNKLNQAISLHIQKVTSRIKALKNEIQDILKSNSNMPITQQINIEEDPCIQDDILSELNLEIDLVKRKLAYPLEVSNLRLEKMIKSNIEPLEIFPFALISILDMDILVKSIRHRKLPSDFMENLEYVNTQVLEFSANKNLSKETKKLRKSDFDTKDVSATYSTSIMDNLPSSPPPPHVLTKALRHYVQRLDRQRLQEIKRKEHLKKQTPYQSENKVEIEDLSSKEYCLKTQLKDLSLSSKYDTLEKMFYCRKEIYDMQHKFNSEIISLREKKNNLVEKYEIFKKRIDQISSILPPDLIKYFPFPKPVINFEIEFPEDHLVTPSEINNEKTIKDSTEIETPDTESNNETASLVLQKENSHNERIISDLLIEQDNLMMNMRTSVEIWEKLFKKLKASRERTLLKAQFLQLHLLYLSQEKIILESFESQENELAQRVIETQQNLESVYKELSIYEKERQETSSYITSVTQQQKDLAIKLNKKIEENQYFGFLKDVFEKRPTNERNNTSSSISLNNEDDSNDNDNEQETTRISVDSIDTCPPGCDPQIFEETLELRSIKWKLDDDLKEQEISMNNINSLISEKNVVIEELLKELETRQNELREVLEKKQFQINDIDSVVILKSNQCRIDTLEQLKPGQGALIFSATVIDNLKSQVQKLLKDADDQKKLYNMSKTHLTRMQADCNFMNSRITELQNQIHHILQQKLNLENKASNVNYESVKKQASKILDSVLECMINQFKVSSTTGLTKDMENQLNQWKKKQYLLEQQYCSTLQEHTSKLRTAAGLLSDSYSNIDPKRKPKFSDNSKFIGDYRRDIFRLKKIQKQQQKQIEDLKSEVQRLRLKPYKSPILPPITPTNISTPLSLATTPPPSELPLDVNTRSIAMSLAKELNGSKADIEHLQHGDVENPLMTVIGEILSLLIEGKINVHEASDIIIGKFVTNKTEEEIETSRHTIAEILSQITNQTIKLGEFENISNTPTFEKNNEPPTESENAEQADEKFSVIDSEKYTKSTDESSTSNP